MANNDTNEIEWYYPEERAIIPLDGSAVIRKSLKQLYRNHSFDLYIDKDFESVISNCANLRKNDTWINQEIIDNYIKLHHMGLAHSFETYYQGKLVGGLYGVSIHKAFFGESMFHLHTGASKVAYMFLIEYLKKNRYLLLDSQFINNHTQSLGAITVGAHEYAQMLQKATGAAV